MRVLVLCALVAVTALGQAKSPLPKGEQTDVYVAKPTASGYDAEVLLPETAAKPIHVTAIDPEVQAAALTTDVLADTTGKPRKVIVHLNQTDLGAGNHMLLLTVALNGKSEEYPIAIAIQPAVLSGFPAKLELTQTTFFWGTAGHCWPEDCNVSIPLRPDNPKSWLTNLRTLPSGPFLKNSSITPGTLTLRLTPTAYDPTNATKPLPQLTITANPTFEIGESTGQVQIIADQLSQAVAVPVTVVNKLSSLVLLPVLILGLLLGFGIRVVQEQKIEQRKLQIEASALDTEIEKRLKTNKDATLAGRLAALRVAIKTGFNAKSSALQQSLKVWKDEFQAAFSDFETRKATFLADAKSLYDVLNQTYELPHGFARIVSEAKGRLAALLALPGNDVVEAEREKDTAEKELTKALKGASIDYESSWGKRREAVESLVPLVLPEAQREKIENEWKAAEEQHAGLSNFARSTDPKRTDLQQALKAVHQNEYFWRDFGPQLPDAFVKAVNKLETEMRDRGYDKDPKWTKWKAGAKDVIALMSRGEWQHVSAGLEDLRKELSDLLRELSAHVPEEKKHDFLADLDRANFVEAIRKLNPPDSRAGGASPAKQEELAEVGGIKRVKIKEIAQGKEPVTASPEELPTVPELEQQLLKVEWGKRLLVGTLILLAGWAILRQSFTGATMDFVTAFGWAFLTDVTTENLVAAFTPFKAKVTL